MTTLKVETMHCNKCVSRIEAALNEVKLDFSVNLDAKTVSVNGDEKAVKLAIEELADLGFDAVI